MKHWIKRTLFGFAGLAVVAGSVAGCAGHRHGWNGDSAEFRAKMVERVGSKLDLDASQKQKLTVLAEKLQAQRQALRGAVRGRAAEVALRVRIGARPQQPRHGRGVPLERRADDRRHRVLVGRRPGRGGRWP